MIDFDMMLVHVGEFGLYQKILFLIQAPFCFFVTWLLFGQVFIFVYPRVYWCEDRCLNFTGLTREQSQNLTIPFVDGAFDYCQTFDVDEQQFQDLASEAATRCTSCTRGNRVPCEFKAEAEAGRSTCVPIDPASVESNSVLRKKRQQWPQRPGGFWPGGPGRNRNNNNNGGFNGFPGGGFNNYNNFNPARPGFNNPPPTEAPPVTPSPTARSDNFATTRRTQNSQTPGRRPGVVTLATTQRSNTVRGQERQPGSASTRGNCPSSRTTSVSSSTDQRRNCPASPDTNWGDQCITNLQSNTFINAENLTARWRNRFRNCENWAYDPNDVTMRYPTVVSEMGWWCDPETWITVASAIFFLGAIVGGVGIGYIADNRGRLPALVAANLLGCIGGTLSAVFYSNYIAFCIFRFICGMGFDNCFTMIYVLVLEYVGPTYRTIAANLSIAIFYTMGTLVLPWLALAIGDWTYYTMAISLPMLLAIIVIFVVPESARWLILQGRIKEATRILRSFAKVNRKNVDDAIFVEFEETATEVFEESQKEKKVTFWDAMKKPRIAKNFILLSLIWSLIALVYNGHSRNILNLGDDVYLLFTIASSTEFPADMLLIFTLDRFGRRWLAFLSLTLSGAFSVASAMVPVDMTTVALVMALLSRFWVNVSLNIGLQYAAELLPTVIRAQGVNTIHIMGNVASIVSPFISSLGRTNPVLSGMILGISAITGGVLALFLPESLGEDLPNTLEDGEVFGKDQSFWNCPICAKKKPESEERPEEIMTPVQLRNRMRASLRGEMYRSSIISGSSSSRRNTPGRDESIRLLPYATDEKAVLRHPQQRQRYTQ